MIIYHLANEHSLVLEEFLQRLLEQPVGQHYHSVSINKHQLLERYEENIRDIIHRHPTFFTHKPEQQSSIRSNRTTSLIGSVPIPVVIHQQHQHHQHHQHQHQHHQHRPLHQHRPTQRGSSPMQQGDDEHDSRPPPSSS